MDQNNQMMELVQKIEEANRRQTRVALLQCVFTLVGAGCCVALLVMVMGMLPRINGIIAQMETVLGNLEQTTSQLAALDMQGMISDVDALVGTGQESLKQMMEKINSIDFKSLNSAINDLADVVEPLAKFFKSFR